MVPSKGLPQAAQSRSMRGESAGLMGAIRNEGSVGEPFAEHGAEREVGKGAEKGAEKGSKGEDTSEPLEGSALRAKGSQSGEGNGSQLVNGFVGEGWWLKRLLSERFGQRPPAELLPPAEMKLQGSMRGRMGDGRGRGMTLTSSRRALGL